MLAWKTLLNFIFGQTRAPTLCYYVNIKPMLARETLHSLFNFISGQAGAPIPCYYVNIKPMLARKIFSISFPVKPDHRYYVNIKFMLADPSSLESLKWLEE